MIKTNIGQAIRSNRKARGISATELGKHLGCTSQFVCNWERGVSNPPLPYIRKICEFVGIGILEAKAALEKDYSEKLKREV